MGNVHRTPLPDLVAGVVDDARQLVEAQVSSLKADVGERLGNLGDAIRSWLVAGCVAIVTASLLGVSLAATLTEVAGLPWYVSLWIVTAVAIGAVAALVYRARSSGRRAVSPSSEPEPDAGADPAPDAETAKLPPAATVAALPASPLQGSP